MVKYLSLKITFTKKIYTKRMCIDGHVVQNIDGKVLWLTIINLLKPKCCIQCSQTYSY